MFDIRSHHVIIGSYVMFISLGNTCTVYCCSPVQQINIDRHLENYYLGNSVQFSCGIWGGHIAINFVAANRGCMITSLGFNLIQMML